MKKPIEPKKGTQRYKILKALQTKKGLTSLDAVKKCGTVSLQRRLADLREMGYCISDSWEYEYDRKGRVVKRWKKYRLCA